MCSNVFTEDDSPQHLPLPTRQPVVNCNIPKMKMEIPERASGYSSHDNVNHASLFYILQKKNLHIAEIEFKYGRNRNYILQK